MRTLQLTHESCATDKSRHQTNRPHTDRSLPPKTQRLHKTTVFRMSLFDCNFTNNTGEIKVTLLIILSRFLWVVSWIHFRGWPLELGVSRTRALTRTTAPWPYQTRWSCWVGARLWSLLLTWILQQSKSGFSAQWPHRYWLWLRLRSRHMNASKLLCKYRWVTFRPNSNSDPTPWSPSLVPSHLFATNH